MDWIWIWFGWKGIRLRAWKSGERFSLDWWTLGSPVEIWEESERIGTALMEDDWEVIREIVE